MHILRDLGVVVTRPHRTQLACQALFFGERPFVIARITVAAGGAPFARPELAVLVPPSLSAALTVRTPCAAALLIPAALTR